MITTNLSSQFRFLFYFPCFLRFGFLGSTSLKKNLEVLTNKASHGTQKQLFSEQDLPMSESMRNTFLTSHKSIFERPPDSFLKTLFKKLSQTFPTRFPKLLRTEPKGTELQAQDLGFRQRSPMTPPLSLLSLLVLIRLLILLIIRSLLELLLLLLLLLRLTALVACGNRLARLKK